MKRLRLISSALATLLFVHQAPASLLLDYNAARGDSPGIIGYPNLEASSGIWQNNSAELYITNDVDWAGTKCAHFHRDNGYLRAEYHALPGRTEANITYFIGYEFAMGAILDGMVVWQWKEYDVAKVSGANIPLAMGLKNHNLQFLFQPDVDSKLQVQWETPVEGFKVYKVGIEILAKADDGYLRVWWNGKPVKFTSTNSTVVTGNMFPSRAEPKFGTYQGKGSDVDTFAYQIQIGNEKSELDNKFF